MSPLLKLSRLSLPTLKLKLRRSGEPKPKPKNLVAESTNTNVGDALERVEEELAKTNDELRLWKFQFEHAQEEIARAQEVVVLVETQQDDAERAAAKAQTLARHSTEDEEGTVVSGSGSDEVASSNSPSTDSASDWPYEAPSCFLDKDRSTTTPSTFEENRRDVQALRSPLRYVEPALSDDEATLEVFLGTLSSAAASQIDMWAIDMRLTLLWCFALEARFGLRERAVELWLEIIERDSGHGRADWGMWTDGDERYLREAIIAHPSHASRLRTTASMLQNSDWIEALNALRSRERAPKKDANNIDYVT
ncbi:hypothetical protein C8F01DRAFT_1371794 [Mycena amicta]|nr:hypothetical protein C8F01DRAFT_1371794 [Mycena amicta]